MSREMSARCLCAFVLLLSTLCTSPEGMSDTGYVRKWRNTGARDPKEIMVDVVNRLGLIILKVHTFNNDNNIALSPYGATSVLTALLEGVTGPAALEIQRCGGFPQDKDIIRIGLRDIHRHLRSYFIPQEGFLSGLSLSSEKVMLSPEYQNMLRFYGFDMTSFNTPIYPPDLMGTTLQYNTTTLAVTTSDVTTTTQMTTLKENDELFKEFFTSSEKSEDTTTATTGKTMTTTQDKITTTGITTEGKITTTVGKTTATERRTTILTTTEEMTTTKPTTVEEPEHRTEESTETTAKTTTTMTTTQETTTQPPTTVKKRTTKQTTTDQPLTTTLIPESRGSVTEGDSPYTSAPTETTATTETTESTDTTDLKLNREITTEFIISTMRSIASPQMEGTMKTASTTMKEMIDADKDLTEEEVIEEIEEATLSQTTEPMTTTEKPKSRKKRATFEVGKWDRDMEIAYSLKMQENLKKWNSTKKFKRSLIDYYIARQYDDAQDITSFHLPYFPRREVPKEINYSFLVNEKFEETGINFMTYEVVLPFHYIHSLNALALRFPLDSPKYYLLLVLPVDTYGIHKLICDIDATISLKEIVLQMRPTYVRAVIPSFMLRGFVILTSTLQKIGIRRIFEPRHADFSPMTNDKNIYVTNIEQAITVTIKNYMDSKSTRSARYQYGPVDFRATHPFLYFVMDSQLDVALVAGKIVNPLNSRIQ